MVQFAEPKETVSAIAWSGLATARTLRLCPPVAPSPDLSGARHAAICIGVHAVRQVGGDANSVLGGDAAHAHVVLLFTAHRTHWFDMYLVLHYNWWNEQRAGSPDSPERR